MVAPTQPPTDVFWTFASIIDPQSSQRVSRWITLLPPGPPPPRLHLLFQSTGGAVGEGIWLHNFFRALPRPMTIYAAGTVASIATIAYLGASTRCAGAGAVFMLHRTTCSPVSRTAAQLRTTLASLEIDDDRTDQILRARTRLTREHFDQLDAGQELIFNAEQAVAVGLADQIAEFRPPPGAPLCSFDVPA